LDNPQETGAASPSKLQVCLCQFAYYITLNSNSTCKLLRTSTNLFCKVNGKSANNENINGRILFQFNIYTRNLNVIIFMYNYESLKIFVDVKKAAKMKKK
jgi:hypothetical protein